MESGYMGVTLFFTLSGFVLAVNYFESFRISAGANCGNTLSRVSHGSILYISS